MLGDTAIAVNPKDDRFKHLVGKYVTFQLLEEKLKLLEDDYADPEHGNWCFKDYSCS